MPKSNNRLGGDAAIILKIINAKIQQQAAECREKSASIISKIDDLNESIEIIARELRRRGDRNVPQ